MSLAPDDVRMTFGEHLEELRRRLMRGILAFAVAFAAAFAFQESLMEFFTRPYERARASLNAEFAEKWLARPAPEHPIKRTVDLLIERLHRKSLLDDTDFAELSTLQAVEWREPPPSLSQLQAVGTLEAFSAYMLECLLAALIVSAPVLLYELWRFVAEGLYDAEKRMVGRVLPVSLLFFFVGLAFGYFVLAELSVRFLVGYGDPTFVRPQVAIGSYLGLLFLLLLVMGLVFQIPLVMWVLSSTGLVGPEFYRGKRRHCILAIFIIAAVITPPDYVSQMLVAVPMLVLFEIGLLLAKSAARLRAVRQRESAS